MIKRIPFLIIIFMCYILPGLAQNQTLYTQYMFNALAINPAYAGSHNAISFTGLVRKQWTGIDGAPESQTLSGHAPLKNRSLAIGMQLYNDKIGVTKQTDVIGSFAYLIKMNNGTLAFGLQTGLKWYREALSDLYEKTDYDYQFSTDNIQALKPTFGSGLFYSNNRFYLGLSVPVIKNNLNENEEDKKVSVKNHYYLTSGFVFDVNSSLKLKPSILIKAVDNSPITMDFNMNLLIKDIIWVGATYRSFESVGVLLEMQLTEQLRLGYSYDIPAHGISKTGNGSHEIVLNYRIKLPETRSLTPRYF